MRPLTHHPTRDSSSHNACECCRGPQTCWSSMVCAGWKSRDLEASRAGHRAGPEVRVRRGSRTSKSWFHAAAPHPHSFPLTFRTFAPAPPCLWPTHARMLRYQSASSEVSLEIRSPRPPPCLHATATGYIRLPYRLHLGGKRRPPTAQRAVCPFSFSPRLWYGVPDHEALLPCGQRGYPEHVKLRVTARPGILVYPWVSARIKSGFNALTKPRPRCMKKHTGAYPLAVIAYA